MPLDAARIASFRRAHFQPCGGVAGAWAVPQYPLEPGRTLGDAA